LVTYFYTSCHWTVWSIKFHVLLHLVQLGHIMLSSVLDSCLLVCVIYNLSNYTTSRWASILANSSLQFKMPKQLIPAHSQVKVPEQFLHIQVPEQLLRIHTRSASSCIFTQLKCRNSSCTFTGNSSCTMCELNIIAVITSYIIVIPHSNAGKVPVHC